MGCSCNKYRVLEEFMFYNGSLSANSLVNVYLFINCKGLYNDEFTGHVHYYLHYAIEIEFGMFEFMREYPSLYFRSSRLSTPNT